MSIALFFIKQQQINIFSKYSAVAKADVIL